jgi:hypothetical protein
VHLTIAAQALHAVPALESEAEAIVGDISTPRRSNESVVANAIVRRTTGGTRGRR